MLQLRSLSFHGTRSPQELLKASGLTQVYISVIVKAYISHCKSIFLCVPLSYYVTLSAL